MSTFAEDIEASAAAAGEPILACVIGGIGYSWREDERYADAHEEPLPWAEARAMLDYEYDTGFGGEDCNPIFAWSENWVYAVHEYDGSTGVVRLPRHPTTIAAKFDGIFS